MPSLRNPVGPLPSSIYWRRRFVALVVLAAVVALIGWLLFGGGGTKKPLADTGRTGPAQSITPGPTGGGSNDGTVGGPSGSRSPSAGASAGSPTGGGTGSPQPVTVTGGGATGGGSGGNGANTAGTMALPVCQAADLELTLTSTEQSYGATQWPVFQLGISNTSGAACRTDLGAKSAVVVVSTGGNSHVWSSADCPALTSSQWYAIPASGTALTADFEWGRTTSAPGCTPGAGGAAATPGTYGVQVSLQGVTAEPSYTFKLAQFGS